MKYQAIQHAPPDEMDLEFTSIAKPLKPGEVQLYVIEAPTWEEAMAEHHQRQGWKPYKPEGDQVPCEVCGTPYYPEGSGECGKCGSAEIPALSTQEIEGMLFYARHGMASRIEFDEYGPRPIVALCEELLRLRAAK